jgi:hypothetical protein
MSTNAIKHKVACALRDTVRQSIETQRCLSSPRNHRRFVRTVTSLITTNTSPQSSQYISSRIHVPLKTDHQFDSEVMTSMSHMADGSDSNIAHMKTSNSFTEAKYKMQRQSGVNNTIGIAIVRGYQRKQYPQFDNQLLLPQRRKQDDNDNDDNNIESSQHFGKDDACDDKDTDHDDNPVHVAVGSSISHGVVINPQDVLCGKDRDIYHHGKKKQEER